MYALDQQLTGRKADLAALELLHLAEVIAVCRDDRRGQLFEGHCALHPPEPADHRQQVLLQPLSDPFHGVPSHVLQLRGVQHATTMPIPQTDEGVA